MSPTIHNHIAFLYGEGRAEKIVEALEALVENFQKGRPPGDSRPLSEADAMLITYGDQLRGNEEFPLRTLGEFLGQRAPDLLSSVHLLPFYPSSSDDGFSVMDYYAIDPALGDWDDVQVLQERFRLMFDAVFNHASAQGDWFGKFLRQEPGWENAFFTVDGSPDLSAVIRPRALPLLTSFETAAGRRQVWTTFSADQADLNFGEPLMLLRILAVLLFYVQKGASFLRLDAIAFLWKIPGTTCLHLEQTHRVIQLMRAVLNEAAPDVQIITETNVPHTDNISYFGDGRNEAQLVYNFALPPLTFHTLRSGDATKLRQWAQSLELPSETVTFFNFLASHDGIGVNPARGILDPAEIAALLQATLDHGGFVSYKNNPDGTQSPYELNISYFDALSDPAAGEVEDIQVARFAAAHSIMVALRGLPGIYFHSLFGSRNDRAGAEASGIPRRINRKKLQRGELEIELDQHGSLRAKVFAALSVMLRTRALHPAFNPYSVQVIPEGPKELFLVERRSPDGDTVLCVTNVTGQPVSWLASGRRVILGEALPSEEGTLTVPPYGVIWLAA